MKTIVKGTDHTFTIRLDDGDGGPFNLAGSTVTVTVRSGTSSAVLVTQTLQVDQFGNVVISDGLTMVGVSADGTIEQTITAAQTLAMPSGLVLWAVTLLDGTGATSTPIWGQWQVNATVYLNAGTTRRELRRRIADRLGDLLILTATAPSLSNTTFIDALTVSSTADNLTGRMISVATGANAGHVALIQSYDISTGTITFNPGAPTTFVAGDEVEVVNERSRGWQIAEYNRAINAAINDAYPQALAEFAYEVPGSFDLTSPFIAVPDTMSHAYDVSWRRAANDAWIPLRKGKWYGWKADPTAGLIQVTSYPSVLADGMTLRICGYGRHPELSSDDDATALLPEWIVAAACYRLAMSGADRDPSGIRGQMILTFQREADQYRPRIRTTPKPGTARVRVI